LSRHISMVWCNSRWIQANRELRIIVKVWKLVWNMLISKEIRINNFNNYKFCLMIRANIDGAKLKKKNRLVWDCCNSNCVVTIVRFQACVHSLEVKRCGHHSQNKPVVYVWKYLSVLSLDFWLLNFILISFRWAEAGGHEQISHKLKFNKQWALLSNSTDRVSASISFN